MKFSNCLERRQRMDFELYFWRLAFWTPVRLRLVWLVVSRSTSVDCFDIGTCATSDRLDLPDVCDTPYDLFRLPIVVKLSKNRTENPYWLWNRIRIVKRHSPCSSES